MIDLIKDYNLYDTEDYICAVNEVINAGPSSSQLQLLKYLTEVTDKNYNSHFQIFLRYNQCLTLSQLNQSFPLFTLVPEMIALEKDNYIDEHLRAPNASPKSLILTAYKWMLYYARYFYQISVADFERYLNDYKKRCSELQCSMRSAYAIEGKYFRELDKIRAKKAFENYRKEPWDSTCDCDACERVLEVSIHLELDDKPKADELAKDLWDKKLQCSAADYQIYRVYLNYFLKKEDYNQALEQCKMIESDNRKNSEIHEAIANLILCYIHFDIGHAVSLYETYCMEGERFKSGNDMLSCQNFAKAACKLWEAVEATSPTIKLNLSPSFPLYSETGEYKVADLYEYYFNIEREIGSKFKERNRIYLESKAIE